MPTPLIIRFLLILMFASCGASSAALAEKKVALVIGNASYSHVPSLKNPENDAKAISKLFTEMGYDVHLVLNADRNGLASAVGDFRQLSTDADAAVFYYAGHGVSLEGRNFLIPVDARIERASDVKLGSGFDAETAIDEALSNARVKLVFLDACRDNPFVEAIKRSLGATRSAGVTSGLSEMKSGEGTLISFSTAPGQTALDGAGDLSPFAAALLKNLAEPGLEVRLAMTKVRADVENATGGQQTPWESTNLTGFYYFSPPPPDPQIPQDSATDQSTVSINTSAELDLEYWRSVRDSTDVALLNSYLSKFPNGVYRDLARARIDQIKMGEPVSSKNNPPASDFSNNKDKASTQVSDDPNEVGGKSDATTDPQDRSDEAITPLVREKKKDSSASTSKKTKSAIVGKPSKQQQVLLKPPPSSSPTKGGDESGYLGKTIRMNSGVWSVPAGATTVSGRSNRNFTVTFKGRTYSCHSRGSGSGSTRAMCRPK